LYYNESLPNVVCKQDILNTNWKLAGVLLSEGEALHILILQYL